MNTLSGESTLLFLFLPHIILEVNSYEQILSFKSRPLPEVIKLFYAQLR